MARILVTTDYLHPGASERLVDRLRETHESKCVRWPAIAHIRSRQFRHRAGGTARPRSAHVFRSPCS